LQKRYGAVWDTRGLAAEFTITAIIGDRIVVRRKADGVVGTLTVQEQPRYYHSFEPSPVGREEQQS
jgi:hypothetical protein